jgi:copper homeostasis protein
MSRYYLEICASSVESAIAAQRGGADRIELCDVLPVGGVSPSYGMISLVRDRLSIPIHVLLRPRSGDFSLRRSRGRASSTRY